MYRVVQSEFDYLFYLAANRDVFEAKIDPVAHYIRAGESEGRHPTKYFSPNAYRRRYADELADQENAFYHWITVGRDRGYVAAPFDGFDEVADDCGLSPTDAQRLLERSHDDVRERLLSGALGEMVVKAAEFEPLIGASWRDAVGLRIPPFQAREAIHKTATIRKLQASALHRRARGVVLVDALRSGPGEQMARRITNALAEVGSGDEIVIVATGDGTTSGVDWLPAGIRVIDAPKDTYSLSDASLQRVLIEFVRSLCPEVVFNVDSTLFWDALEPYGRALSHSARLVGCFPTKQLDGYGHWAGHQLTMFYRHFDILSAAIVGSDDVASELIETYQVPAADRERIVVLGDRRDVGTQLVRRMLDRGGHDG